MNDDFSINDIDPRLLTDISEIFIDSELSVKERIKQFLEQSKSPYLFRVNGRAVKLVFNSNTNFTFEEGITNALNSIFISKS